MTHKMKFSLDRYGVHLEEVMIHRAIFKGEHDG